MGKASGIILAILIIFLLVMSYTLMNAIKDNTSFIENLIPMNYSSRTNVNISSYDGNELQFYSNMRFNHNEITYRINPECSFEQADRFTSAASSLDDSITQISLKEVPWSTSENADIDVLCGGQYIDSEELYVAGEGGPKFVLNGTIFTTILGGKVVLYRDSCSYNVELHELLHVFGFKHSNNQRSVMYNTSFCNQFLTSDIIKELNRLYSYEALADLYFENIKVVKHGIYIDFNVSIRNQGIIDSPPVTLRILGDDEKVRDFDLGITEFGGGRTLNAQNIKLPSRDIKEVTFILDPEDTINEYSKDNNRITLEVKE